MHFATVVILPKDENAEDLKVVERMLAPYDENGAWFADGSRWDWWVVGGRWDGAMLGLPWLELKEPCRFCKGTGVSAHATLKEDGTYHHVFFGGTESDYPYGCHVCKGTKVSDVFTTDDGYQDPKRNTCKGESVAEGFVPYAFIDPDGEWHEQARAHWFGNFTENEDGNPPMSEDVWEKEWAEAQKRYADHLFVLVDCHV